MVKTDGEKIIETASRHAELLAGELHTMAWRMRGIRYGMTTNRNYYRRDWEQDMAELSGYLNTIEKMCNDHAVELQRVYRLAIKPLKQLAGMARENDY